jgi:hypothetical protein
MPKRLIDDSFLSSPSLAKCSPRAQDAFPRFILVADDFGCFEAIPRVLVAKAWPYRSDVSEADVKGWLEEYVAAGMAVLWTEAERRFCYLTGWNGPHGQRKRAEYDPMAPKGTPGAHGSKRRTPAPPPELVAAVLAGYRRAVDGKPAGTDREDSEEIASGSLPGRELRGNCAGDAREIRGSAAPAAVPAAVLVPAAAAPKAGGGRRDDDDLRPPLRIEDNSGPRREGEPTSVFPEAEKFRTRISDSLARMPPFPWLGNTAAMRQVEARLALWDFDAALAYCRERALAAQKMPRAMAWFATVLQDEPTKRRQAPEAPLPDGPPAYVALLQHASEVVASEAFRRDLATAKPEERDGVLWLTPSDPYQEARLKDPAMFGKRLPELAAQVGVTVRVGGAA